MICAKKSIEPIKKSFYFFVVLLLDSFSVSSKTKHMQVSGDHVEYMEMECLLGVAKKSLLATGEQKRQKRCTFLLLEKQHPIPMESYRNKSLHCMAKSFLHVDN